MQRAGLDVVKSDSPENTLGRIPKHDGGGVSRLADNLPEAAEQPTRRQRNNTIAAVLPRENVFQDLRRHTAEFMRCQVTASKALNRHSEETLCFNVQVEKPILKQGGQLRPQRGLADTADSSEEYAHVATFDESRDIPVRTRRL